MSVPFIERGEAGPGFTGAFQPPLTEAQEPLTEAQKMQAEAERRALLDLRGRDDDVHARLELTESQREHLDRFLREKDVLLGLVKLEDI